MTLINKKFGEENYQKAVTEPGFKIWDTSQ